ncbi:hypothetical protein C8J57DRAFT_1628817 [Mycena rebaudengoi]|nr:hypothetical protein C8J57DRAFT_1628817 [Mycena rebaudengoi]
MAIPNRPATTKDRVLQYGTVACPLLKDIGKASNQPYLQAIASVSLLIMETAQRVKENKEGMFFSCFIAISGPDAARSGHKNNRAMQSTEQFSETLKTILTFVRSQVMGRFWRRVFRSMEDADLITECNTGLKDALDVFGELVAILDKKKHPKRSSDSSSSGGSHSSRKKRHSSTQLNRSIDGVGKTALTFAAAHDPQIRERFGQSRFFVDCTAAGDGKQLISLMAAQLGREEPARPKAIFKHLTATEAPALIVLDVIGRPWKPFEHRNDVEDFLSLLADLDHVTIIASAPAKYDGRARSSRRSTVFRPTPRATFLDISDVASDDPGLDPLLLLTENMPGMIIRMAALASFERCTSLVARWENEGPTVLCETVDKGSEDAPL